MKRIKMISKLLLVVSALVGLTVVSARAEDEAAKPATDTAAKKKSNKKSTEVSFDEALVQGKYHFSDEAVTTVEQDKILDALLGVRTDFKDRLKKSASRH